MSKLSKKLAIWIESDLRSTTADGLEQEEHRRIVREHIAPAMAVVEAAIAIRQLRQEPDETYMERFDPIIKNYEEAIDAFLEVME